MKELFGAIWLCVGREEELPRAGDFFTVPIGPERLLLVRGEDDAIRVFYNVCRHRGARIIDDDRGSALKQLQSRYHAWTYHLDGRLLSAPRMESGAGFCREDYPLAQVKLEIWDGFLFINLDLDAVSLERPLADFPDLSRYRLAELRSGHRNSYELQANWKLVCENYAECYHCTHRHPELSLVSDYRSGGSLIEGECFNGAPNALKTGIRTMTLGGNSNRGGIAGLTEEDHRLVHYYNLYPNFLIGLHADCVVTHTIWPQDPSRCRVVCEWLFSPDDVCRADFDPRDAVELWDITNQQDWELCEMAQRGLRSRGHRPGPYQAGEACVHAFDRWLLRRLGSSLEDLVEPELIADLSV